MHVIGLELVLVLVFNQLSALDMIYIKSSYSIQRTHFPTISIRSLGLKISFGEYMVSKCDMELTDLTEVSSFENYI